jgi:hypothetical protein
LERRDRGYMKDGVRVGAAREIGDGHREPLEDRAYCFGVRQPFGEFVRDVPGVEVREDQDVRAAGDLTSRRFADCDIGDQRGVGLEVTVDDQIRGARFYYRERCLNGGDRGTGAAAAFGALRQEGDSRLVADDLFARGGGGDGDVGELKGRWIGDYGAVGEAQDFRGGTCFGAVGRRR